MSHAAVTTELLRHTPGQRNSNHAPSNRTNSPQLFTTVRHGANCCQRRLSDATIAGREVEGTNGNTFTSLGLAFTMTNA
jgi:hypothetical protein